jgi:hypothetical protein
MAPKREFGTTGDCHAEKKISQFRKTWIDEKTTKMDLCSLSDCSRNHSGCSGREQ